MTAARLVTDRRSDARPRTYRVYVIELRPEVLAERKFRNENPNYVEGKPCVYVGQTARPREVRYAQHREGKKANAYVRKYHIGLRPDLLRHGDVEYADRREAERAERKLANRLRSEGFGVWWG